jgi:hypothetical protein
MYNNNNNNNNNKFIMATEINFNYLFHSIFNASLLCKFNYIEFFCFNISVLLHYTSNVTKHYCHSIYSNIFVI